MSVREQGTVVVGSQLDGEAIRKMIAVKLANICFCLRTRRDRNLTSIFANSRHQVGVCLAHPSKAWCINRCLP